MTQPPCFDRCGRLAGGCGSYCAYCPECCERYNAAARPLPAANQHKCGACRVTFLFLTDFDDHQSWDYPAPVVCKAPESMGLVCRESDGAWMSPESLESLTARSARMASARSLALAQTA